MSFTTLQAIAAAIPAGEPGDAIDANRLAITRAVIERLVEIGPGLMVVHANFARVMHLQGFHPDDHQGALLEALRAGLQSLLPREPK